VRLAVAKALMTFVNQARQVERQHGVSVATQIAEAARLKQRTARFSLQDYFDFRLFERTPEAEDRRRHLAGSKWQAFLEYELNDQRWKCLVDDKVVTYALMRAAGVPTPALAAVYTPQRRVALDAHACATEAEVGAYLRHTSRFPLFVKPIRGSVGKGAAVITGYDGGDDALILADGSHLPVATFTAQLADPTTLKHAAAGYVLQDVVRQHPTLVQAAGTTVSTARIVVMVGDESREILSAVWRVARTGNVTDNFDKGRSGNLIAAIDTTSGEITRVISGYGLTETVVRTHPDTGAMLTGLRLPDWHCAVDLVCRGASAFPNLRLQHWDVAFSDAGPVALEVNAMGSTGMLQYASGKGLVTPSLTAFLNRYGLSGRPR
jgi:hypothetical protein